MPRFGPFVTKIHLFDNEIDCLQPNGFAIIQKTISAYARFVIFLIQQNSLRKILFKDLLKSLMIWKNLISMKMLLDMFVEV